MNCQYLIIRLQRLSTGGLDKIQPIVWEIKNDGQLVLLRVKLIQAHIGIRRVLKLFGLSQVNMKI